MKPRDLRRAGVMTLVFGIILLVISVQYDDDFLDDFLRGLGGGMVILGVNNLIIARQLKRRG